MKKVIISIALVLALTGCKKSDIELEIEQYELKQAKLEYLETLVKTKEALKYEERKRLIDSLIFEEKTKIDNDHN